MSQPPEPSAPATATTATTAGAPSAAPGPLSSSGDRSPVGAKRWFFQLKLDPEPTGAPRERLVGYVVVSTRTLTRPAKAKANAKAAKPVDVKITALRLEEGGRLVGETDLERLGIPGIPVEPISPHQTLVERTVDGETSVWWRVGRLAETDAEVDALLTEAPDFVPPTRAGKKPKDPPMDVAVHFASTFGSERVTCTSFVHPAPETGDTFDLERCFAPALGTLAFTKLVSVWGSYELTLLNTAH